MLEVVTAHSVYKIYDQKFFIKYWYVQHISLCTSSESSWTTNTCMFLSQLAAPLAPQRLLLFFLLTLCEFIFGNAFINNSYCSWPLLFNIYMPPLLILLNIIISPTIVMQITQNVTYRCHRMTTVPNFCSIRGLNKFNYKIKTEQKLKETTVMAFSPVLIK